MSFSNASSEVKEIATRYINKHHTHLANVMIVYLFNAKSIVKKGKEKLGEVKLISGMNAYLITRDLQEPQEQLFVMIISKSAWDLLENQPGAREALIDHELCHLDRDLETSALSVNPHDVEEFFDIVRRHGAWAKDIQNLIDAAKEAKNPMLPFDLGSAREELARSQEPEEDENEEQQAAASTKVRHIKRGKKGEEEQAAAATGE
jgi:hypothetical protein